jgi:hypothetical protein
VDEAVVGDSLLDAPNKVVLPKEFPRVSPSEPRKGGCLSGIWERNRKGY